MNLSILAFLYSDNFLNFSERAANVIKEKVSIDNKTVSFDEFNKFFEGK